MVSHNSAIYGHVHIHCIVYKNKCFFHWKKGACLLDAVDFCMQKGVQHFCKD